MASAAGGSGSKPIPRVVICGGGIIGAATAYYLAKKGLAEGVTLVERHEPACAASGKAGGFLALDWNDSSPVGPLARLSYRLHAQLAEEMGAERLGYRGVHTLQVVGVEKPTGGSSGRRLRGLERLPDWVDGQVVDVSEMGDPSNTAQVHPHKLTTALLEAAVTRGSVVLRGCVEGLRLEDAEDGGGGGGAKGRRVTGVLVDGSILPADVVVIAMGPWSGAARDWLTSSPTPPSAQQATATTDATTTAAAATPAAAAAAAAAGGGCSAPGGPRQQQLLLPALHISGQKYHSVVLRPQQPVSGHMLFTGFKYASGRTVEPEVYPRPDGTVYVCGEPQALPLPPSADEVTVEGGLIDNIRRVAGSLASCLEQAPVEAAQACYLPYAPDSLPVIGPVPGCGGAYLATGHTCWGILNGPATGLLLAEMIAGGRATSCNVAAFSPARLGDS